MNSSLASRASQLGRDGSPIEEVMLRARTLIGERVSFETFSAGAFDPVARLPSWSLLQSRVPSELLGRWGTIEITNPRNMWLSTDAAPPTTSRLSDEVQGVLERSRRYREVYCHAELKHELRLLLCAGGLVWGYLCLIRDAAEPDFAREEVALVDTLSTPLGEAVRRTMLGGPASNHLDDSPAVLILSPEDRIVSSTDAAEKLLPELTCACAHRCERENLLAVRTVAQVARRPQAWRRPAVVRALGRDGRWFTIRGSAHHGTQQVALVIEPIRPPDAATLMLTAYGLSVREREIALHVLRGLSTKGIGEALRISEYTVQDHLKSIFDKTGFSSRKELARRLFQTSPG